MNVTEVFKSTILHFITLCHTSDRVSLENILDIKLEHEGKKYALKIVELDAELPTWEELTLGLKSIYKIAQQDMTKDGWVKGVNNEDAA